MRPGSRRYFKVEGEKVPFYYRGWVRTLQMATDSARGKMAKGQSAKIAAGPAWDGTPGYLIFSRKR